MRLKAAAFAFGAPHIEIAQELHLDPFKTRSAAAFAAAAPGIERKRAGGQPLRHRFRLRGEELANAVVESEIKNRRRARCTREPRLIDHHHVADAVRAGDRLARPGFLLTRLSFRLKQVPIKNFVNERRLARSGNAGDAVENAQRNFDIEVLEIVLPGAGDSDRGG